MLTMNSLTIIKYYRKLLVSQSWNLSSDKFQLLVSCNEIFLLFRPQSQQP